MNLNLNEQLMVSTNGDAEVCIFIANLAGWMNTNFSKDKPEDRNLHEGRIWSFNSYPEFAKYFTFWTSKKVRVIVQRALKLELIMVSNFNRKKYDNTNWYTLTDKALDCYPVLRDKLSNTPAQMGRPPAQMGRPIPEDLNSLGSNINITTSDVNNFKTQEVIEAYHETLPELPKIKVVGNELTKQIRSMIRNWHKYQKDGNAFTLESFKDYLRFIERFYPWFLKPYTTDSGKTKRNNLTNITREKNIVRFVNGEFSAI